MASPAPRFIALHDGDNVAVSLDDLEPGDALQIAGHELTLGDAIPFGHKFALVDIPAGGEVWKYEEVIGLATEHIPAGHHVHVHNVASRRGGT